MADPRFFENAGPFSLSRIAEVAGAEIVNGGDGSREFTDVRPLAAAGPEHVSFLDNRKYKAAFLGSRAGACIVSADIAEIAPDGATLLVTPKPYHGYARVAALFYPDAGARAGIDASASVDPTAHVAESAEIGPGARIGAAAEIGARARIGANAVIGNGVRIGDDTTIGPGAVLAYCTVGSRTVIHAGAAIGQDGFGFALGPEGHEKVPQLGRVIIGDDVDIGANTAIDRGSGPDTVIGDGTKIDNLVQIAHNVVIGRNAVIVAQAGVSGSSELGDFAVLAGQVGIAGHIKIGAGARIAAKSGVMRDVPAGQEQGGIPAKPFREWMRECVALGKLVRNKET